MLFYIMLGKEEEEEKKQKKKKLPPIVCYNSIEKCAYVRKITIERIFFLI